MYKERWWHSLGLVVVVLGFVLRIWNLGKLSLWGGKLWSDGGLVGTVGQTTGLENLKKYVKNQDKKS